LGNKRALGKLKIRQEKREPGAGCRNKWSNNRNQKRRPAFIFVFLLIKAAPAPTRKVPWFVSYFVIGMLTLGCWALKDYSGTGMPPKPGTSGMPA